MNIRTDLLIIGAGPFGLSMAAYAKHYNLDFRIVGKPMEFWKNNMPRGMYLRSGPDWHIDPCNVHTINNFMKSKNINPDDAKPIPRELYLQYTDWFRREKSIEPVDSYVSKLDYYFNDRYPFKSHLDNNYIIESRTAVIAVGFGYFEHIPEEFVSKIPKDQYSHTSGVIDFTHLKSRDCIILGGRQSAFEWASLISNAGANKIHVIHRHKTPEFSESDWSWVDPVLERITDNPDYYLGLSKEEKNQINDLFWKEGRLKLEPWLAHTKNNERISIYPGATIGSITMGNDSRIQVRLDKGDRIMADYFIFATGFKVEITRVPFLSSGNILRNIETVNGYPKLKAGLQSSIPGLFFTSLAATQAYGAFFGFTVSCVASAKMIGSEICVLLSDD